MSAGLWKGRTIRLRGFRWLKGKEKEVGLGSFQSRILCEHHNHKLSPLDAEAKKTLDTFESLLWRLQSDMEPETWYADGSKFERWAAKFLVGVLCAEELGSKWFDNGSRALEPPPWIVRAIFNHEEFKKPAGLYFATEYQADLVSGLGIGPLYVPDNAAVVGGDISFSGFRFLIWLTREPMETFSIPRPTGVISKSDDSELSYHMETMAFRSNDRKQTLIFRWVS